MLGLIQDFTLEADSLQYLEKWLDEALREMEQALYLVRREVTRGIGYGQPVPVHLR